ncbi:ABC transporter ATP-binding protein [Kytococcus schroeteri]|uniref:ABC transporter ATP-binding protein n=1 Tax=Kytococcus schroeteri TaxID=138300 RepID=A0A2I1PC71_9MICO|nr:ABC transporter ATP-binding protein [Kytococcus schroeteri]PKZ42216.1 ABC transporter ATP-binding protein [Kytococcus schroeteri]
MRLRTDGLSAAVGRTTVLQDVTFEVPSGTVTSLVGVNGSGKSTLLRTIAGIRPAPAGQVWLGDRTVDRIRPRERARRLALVAQDEAPPEDLLLGEMIAMGRTPLARPWEMGDADERRAVLEALDQVGLTGMADRPCSDVSGGESRRALLARGLVQQTPILLLDEPTNHLDVAQQHHLLTLVRGSGRTTVMAVHDLGLAAQYSDQVVVLDAGRVLTSGTPAEVFADPRVADVFSVRFVTFTDPETGSEHFTCLPRTPQPHQEEA